MKHKPIKLGWPPKRIIARERPIKSIGEFYSDLTDEDQKTARWVAKAAEQFSRPLITRLVEDMREAAKENAVLVQLEARLKYEREIKEIKSGKS